MTFFPTHCCLKTIAWGMVCTFLCTCSSPPPQDPDAVLKQVFTEQEMGLVNQIIDYYDAYVWSQTDTALPIDKAYQQFFDKNCKIITISRTGDGFVPPREDRVRFFRNLNQEVLSDLFIIKDSLFFYDSQTDEIIEARYFPYQFNLLIGGKISELLNVLSVRNEFYRIYYDRMMQIGGITPSTIYILIYKSYPKNNPYRKSLAQNKADFNFKNKEERFISILPFLFIDDSGDAIRLFEKENNKEIGFDFKIEPKRKEEW